MELDKGKYSVFVHVVFGIGIVIGLVDSVHTDDEEVVNDARVYDDEFVVPFPIVRLWVADISHTPLDKLVVFVLTAEETLLIAAGGIMYVKVYPIGYKFNIVFPENFLGIVIFDPLFDPYIYPSLSIMVPFNVIVLELISVYEELIAVDLPLIVTPDVAQDNKVSGVPDNVFCNCKLILEPVSTYNDNGTAIDPALIAGPGPLNT